jgi:hypothetical protein
MSKTLQVLLLLGIIGVSFSLGYAVGVTRMGIEYLEQYPTNTNGWGSIVVEVNHEDKD